jgi:hypothetical protein
LNCNKRITFLQGKTLLSHFNCNYYVYLGWLRSEGGSPNIGKLELTREPLHFLFHSISNVGQGDEFIVPELKLLGFCSSERSLKSILKLSFELIFSLNFNFFYFFNINSLFLHFNFDSRHLNHRREIRKSFSTVPNEFPFPTELKFFLLLRDNTCTRDTRGAATHQNRGCVLYFVVLTLCSHMIFRVISWFFIYECSKVC